MRFFSCYGTARMDPRTQDSSKSAVEDMRRLASPHTVEDAVAAVRSTLRRRGRSLARLGTGDWKPSLHAIAEDNVVAPVKARANKAAEQMTRAAATARRNGKRCAPSAHSRGRGDNYSRDPMPMMVVPTFAPTPFMF
ncbi:hypothetical protein V2J09_017578 [Rumex salicifolius]